MASRWLRASYRVACAYRSLEWVLLGCFTFGYFAATCDLASLKPFSFDELTTYNIARLPSAADVWRAWFESGDGVPPSVHLVTHFVGSALGFSHITARLPEIVGVWFACLCIYIFLKRRVSPMLALLGMLMPLTVPVAYAYAYEARGYGVVLGFAGAAVVCWDLARDFRWRPVALVGLPISLTGAVATHLFAVLLIVPLATAELAKTIERRRVDWWVWMGLAAAGLLFVPANPVVAHIRGLNEMAIRAHAASVSELVQLWPQFLSTAGTYLGLLALVCLCRSRVSPADAPAAPTTAEGQPSPADWVLVVGLMSLPAIGWVFATLVTGFLLFRYVIAAVIGFSLAVPLLCQAAIAARPEIALLLVGWVAVSAVEGTLDAKNTLRTTLTTRQIADGRGCFRLLTLWTRLPPDGLPIVVSDFNVFHQLHHYAPEGLKQRLVFAVDREFGRLIEPYMPYYGWVFGERMEVLEPFLGSNRAFYLYDCGTAGRFPLIERLLDAGASVRDSGLADTPSIELRRDLYRVSMPGGSG